MYIEPGLTTESWRDAAVIFSPLISVIFQSAVCKSPGTGTVLAHDTLTGGRVDGNTKSNTRAVICNRDVSIT